MPAKLVADIITEIRTRADISQSFFVTDVELLAMVNSDAGEMYDVLTSSGEDFQVSILPATLSSSDVLTNSNFLPVPDDMNKLRGIDRLFGGTWITLYRVSFQERGRWNWPLAVPPINFVDTYYRLSGDRIYLYPPQSAAGDYQIHYTADYTELLIGDSLPGYMATSSWYELIISGVCAKIMVKQDLDPSYHAQQKEMQKARIIDAAIPRDSGGVRHAVDTRSLKANRGWGGPWGDGGWS